MRGYNPLLPASRGVYTYCNKMLESKVLDYNMFLKFNFGRRPQNFKIGRFF